MPAVQIARKLKRTEGATRQKAHSIALPLQTDYRRTATGYYRKAA